MNINEYRGSNRLHLLVWRFGVSHTGTVLNNVFAFF